eukprot:TRINITY_DN22251_c0_g1_i1.p1 TRINITY_DN22251_c0_g1~~TRINITY_DN22251_c0_g1_i1.p1  ORF type:complete len:140 (-),score=21.67 TRINITY_DN22251_c0_g1_i1:34-453(-)
MCIRDRNYKTAADISNCKHLSSIIDEAKDYISRKTAAANCIFTLQFPIPQKTQMLGPHLILGTFPCNKQKLNSTQNMMANSVNLTQAFKCVDLTETFAIPSLPSNDPVIALLNSGYNYFKANAEPVSYTHLTLPTICSV